MSLKSEGSTAVLCATKAECAKINDTIREMKKSSGDLGEDVANINGRGFAINDCVIFLKNDRDSNVKNGQVGVVSAFSGNTLSINTEFGVKKIDINPSYGLMDSGIH